MKDTDLNKESRNKEEENTDYLALGISYGMSCGLLIGTLLSLKFGIICLAFGNITGMMVGMAIGYNIKKR